MSSPVPTGTGDPQATTQPPFSDPSTGEGRSGNGNAGNGNGNGNAGGGNGVGGGANGPAGGSGAAGGGTGAGAGGAVTTASNGYGAEPDPTNQSSPGTSVTPSHAPTRAVPATSSPLAEVGRVGGLSSVTLLIAALGLGSVGVLLSLLITRRRAR